MNDPSVSATDTMEAKWVPVAVSEDVPEGGRAVIRVRGVEIGIFRIAGDLVAWENSCAHVGGPVCQGSIIPRVLENLDDEQRSAGYSFSDERIHIVCPWHGYEYDLRSGEHPGRPSVRLRGFAVREADGSISVDIHSRR